MQAIVEARSQIQIKIAYQQTIPCMALWYAAPGDPPEKIIFSIDFSALIRITGVIHGSYPTRSPPDRSNCIDSKSIAEHRAHRLFLVRLTCEHPRDDLQQALLGPFGPRLPVGFVLGL
jgi:hypothetical protein